MKSKEKENIGKKKQSDNNPKNLLQSFYQNYSSELEFIVPWVQISKHGLERHKNLLENEKN